MLSGITVQAQEPLDTLIDQAVVSYNQGDYKTAFSLFDKLANQGNADAQYNLGIMYENGLGVIKNETQAVYWYQKAANQGYANAQHNLGIMYANGEGVIQDDKQAVYWFQRAVNQGYAGS